MSENGRRIVALIARRSSLALCVLVAGCSSLRLVRPLRSGPADWPTYAGSAARTNAADASVAPPLVADWTSDISAGVGNGSPLLVDSMLFIGNLRGEVYALNLYTGKKAGSIDLGEAIQGSPVISENVLYIAESNTRGSLLAFDPMTARVLWRADCGDLEVSPLLLDDCLFVGNTAGRFLCVDRRKGTELWKFEIPDNARHDGIRSSAAGVEQTVVFGAENGTLFALDAKTGKQRWACTTDGGIVGSPSIADSTVYAGTLGGTMWAIDLASGRPRWHSRADAPIYGGAALAHHLVIFGTVGGSMNALHSADGSPAWSVSVGGPIDSAPVVADTLIYVGTVGKKLIVLRLSDGSVAWETALSGRVKTSPAVGRGRVFVATDEQEVIAFRGSTR